MGARDDPALVNAEALMADLWREYLAPPPRLTVTEWAEQHRVLSGKDSAEPGPYRTARTPYAREPMDCLSQHSPVEEVVLMWGAQTSKTTVMSNWIGYLADVNPGPVMIVQPTIDMAKRYSRQRLAPMIEESPRLRARVRENRSRDEANTTLLKEFPGGFLAVAGANSAAGLRSMPVRDLATDEEDGYPLDVDGEGDPVQLARARQTTFARRKHLRTSTPTTEGVSRIEAAFLDSDRCRYHVPCPHCGEHQPLEWGSDKPHGLRWQKDADGRAVPETAHYVCRACGAAIAEHHKPGMLAAGRWVADRPGHRAGRVRGFHLSSLYSPLGWLSWAEIVREWQAAQDAMRAGDVSLVRVFVNTRLAETWKEQGDRADEHALRRRAEDWPLRTCPWGVLLLTAGVDVQGDRLEAYCWGHGRANERWLVDHVVIYGDPSVAETEPGSPWAQLTEWRRMAFAHAGGQDMRIRALAVDSGGHHTQAVYAYTRRHAHEHVIAVKGASTPGRPVLGKPSDIEVNHQGRKLRGTRLWVVGTDTAKGIIYGLLRVEAPGPGYVHTSRETPAYVYEQLTAERLATRYVRGRPRLEWVKPAGKRNEALDCAVYAEAAAHYVGVPRMSERQWAALEADLRQGDLLAGARAAPPPAADATAADAPAGPAAHPDNDNDAPADGTPQEPPATPAPATGQATSPAARPQRHPATPGRRGSGWIKRW